MNQNANFVKQNKVIMLASIKWKSNKMGNDGMHQIPNASHFVLISPVRFGESDRSAIKKSMNSFD